MNEPAFSFEAEIATIEAQHLFQRMLTGWAMDLLSLQRAGLDTPTYREPAIDEPSSFFLKDAA